MGGACCPACGMAATHRDCARPTVDPDDPALDADAVAQLLWYHTSTQPDWPSRSFDPTADWTGEARSRFARMCGPGAEARWVAAQRAKALHVGTYEAAIENMLRRMANQADQAAQFHLYRVRLKSLVTVRSGWQSDVGGFVGDVPLAEVCPGGVHVTRYLNDHEDAGSLSLALGREAIQDVQQVAIPLAPVSMDEMLESVSLAEALPATLRYLFTYGTGSNAYKASDSSEHARGLVRLVLQPHEVLEALDASARRDV